VCQSICHFLLEISMWIHWRYNISFHAWKTTTWFKICRIMCLKLKQKLDGKYRNKKHKQSVRDINLIPQRITTLYAHRFSLISRSCLGRRALNNCIVNLVSLVYITEASCFTTTNFNASFSCLMKIISHNFNVTWDTLMVITFTLHQQKEVNCQHVWAFGIHKYNNIHISKQERVLFYYYWTR